MSDIESMLHNAVHNARSDLRSAQINLWRARKWNYRPRLIRHFERLVGVYLDHLWDVQEELAEYERRSIRMVIDDPLVLAMARAIGVANEKARRS